MKIIHEYLPVFLILFGITGGIFTYQLKDKRVVIEGVSPKHNVDFTIGGIKNEPLYEVKENVFSFNQTARIPVNETYPVAIESGLTGAGIGTGIFSASCLLAGVFLISKRKNED